MKSSSILALALVAVGGLVAYSVFASLPSPAEARLDKLLVDKGANASNTAQTKAAWAATSPADKASLDGYVTASDKATNAAEMTAAADGADKVIRSAQASGDKNTYAVVLALYMSYADKRVGFGLPSH